jgi:hypothetical protein
MPANTDFPVKKLIFVQTVLTKNFLFTVKTANSAIMYAVTLNQRYVKNFFLHLMSATDVRNVTLPAP